MDWSNAYTAVRQGPPIGAMSLKHGAALLGNLIIGRTLGILNISSKYRDHQQAVPLNQRKVTTEALNRSTGSESEVWKPLGDIMAKEAEGKFGVFVNHSRCKAETAEFEFSETSAGSAPFIALFAKAAANALAPEKGNEAEEIRIEAKIGASSTTVKIYLQVDSDLLSTIEYDLGSLTKALYGLDAGKAMEALLSETGRAVLSRLRPGEHFEQALEDFKALIENMKAQQAKQAQQAELSEFEMAPSGSKVDAYYKGATCKKDEVILKFNCDKNSRPIVELIGRVVADVIAPHSVNSTEVVFKSGSARIRCKRRGASEEAIVPLGNAIDKLLNVLRGVDCNEAVPAVRSPEGKAVLHKIENAREFERALKEWKSALEQAGTLSQSE